MQSSRPTPDLPNGNLHFSQLTWLTFRVEKHPLRPVGRMHTACSISLGLSLVSYCRRGVGGSGVSTIFSLPFSSVQDVSEWAAWGVLVCEPQHWEADPGSPHHPGGPRVSSLLQ